MVEPSAPVLLAGQWRPADAVATFHGYNPSTGEQLPTRYPVSSRSEVLTAIEAGKAATAALRAVTPEQIATFLEAYADGIEAQREALAAMAHEETGLPLVPRLRDGELLRTSDQLRQAARAARSRTWSRPTIDHAANIRSRLEALGGPVLIIGPNNFPFAFNGVSGGDAAAALAAGNPIIAKGHPAHPGTTRLLAEIAHDALRATGMPRATVQMLYHMEAETGRAAVAHPALGATAFTGSRGAGLTLKSAADAAGKPIYLEMGSLNPVLLLPGALDERAEEIAEEFFASCTLGSGQFCTNPGLILLQAGTASERFVTAAAAHFRSAAAGTLLAENVASGMVEGVEAVVEAGAEVVAQGSPPDRAGFRAAPMLLRVSGTTFLDHAEALQREVFGPASLLVLAAEEEEMTSILGRLEGNLTGTIYSHSGNQDEASYARLEPLLRARVGRLLNDKMPTGVAVSPAMNHGGPFPASGHPGFTAVGIPAALARFAALRSYDNVRPHRLPPELRDQNPLAIERSEFGLSPEE